MKPPQVRCALSAVIDRIMANGNMFDEKGWLLPGVYGCQPGLAEMYINRGSLYLCSAVFLALGLSPEDPFWTGEDEDWTAKKIWRGEDMPFGSRHSGLKGNGGLSYSGKYAILSWSGLSNRWSKALFAGEIALYCIERGIICLNWKNR